MPRSGGESGKLGDRYEAVWTIDSLLDVLSGEAVSVVVEPFEPSESLGIEFKKELAGGTEFHSAKRQTSEQLWSLAELTRVAKNGRSVLSDLLSKLQRFTGCQVIFVSGTTARDLETLCEAAAISHDAPAFQERLDTTDRQLRRRFEDKLLIHFSGSLASAWQALRRIRVVGWTESEMIRRIDQRISGALYRPSGAPLDATAVRCLLADMVLGWFGQAIRRQAIIEFLAEHGVAERDWTRERGPREIVEKRNDAYMGHVEAELIAGERIPRAEAEQAADALVRGDKKRVVFIGAAGRGKSCAVTQTLSHLRQEGIPHLALRLDMQVEVLTSRRLGQELGLPESPVLVLAGIANGGRCVLILDQLDAISFASGRNQHLWDVFEEMLSEAQSYPQMRALLACRAFDVAHDPRLRRILADSDKTARIELGELPVATVRALVQDKAGIDPAALHPAHLELLRTPLHLSLYLQSDPRSHPSFSGVQDLLGRYWTYKRRLVAEQLGRESRWHDIIQRLVARLSRDQTLSASRTVLDPFDEAEVGAMASHNVIVLDGNAVRFFHEAFFDYCSARLFAEQGRTLLEFLLEGGYEQHLFRRAQVRQILEYERERDFAGYIRDMRELLTDGRVRYHLKNLALDWLRELAAPREEEWRLLESLDPATPIGVWARRVPWGKPAWVLLLDQLGVWEQWLESPDANTVRVAVLSLRDAMKICSGQIARMFRPYLDGQKPWRGEFGELFSLGELHHSREMFELLLDATRARLLETPNRIDLPRYEELAKVRPDYAVELLAVILDLESERVDEEDADESEGEIAANFVIEAARGAPEAFAREVLPRVISELEKGDPRDPHGWAGRRFSRRMSFHAYDASSTLEKGLETALGVLAKEQPDVLDSLTETAEPLPDKPFAALLLSAWSNNGTHYADKIVNYLLSEPDRLSLGYLTWDTGNGTAAVARAAIRAASPHCSPENYARMEAVILAFTPEREREETHRLGYHRMLLLESLPGNRISREAWRHFEELKRKFPWEKFEMPGHAPRGGFEEDIHTRYLVRSPIPQEATKHMTDEQWLGAMREYAGERERNTADFLKGGKHQLVSVLRLEAQADKPRFARLALRMEDTIAPEYFGAIVSGITTTKEDTSVSPKLPASAQEPLDVQEVVRVIQRVHAIAGRAGAREICWAIDRIAHQRPLREIIPIVCDYAMHDPDPEKEQWQEMSRNLPIWDDPLFHGMNSVRGAAAQALAALLFAYQSWFSEIEPAVLSVVRDRSIAVRSCAIRCLLAMLNFDRDRAVRLFLELCDGAEAVLRTQFSEPFIHHANYRHYDSLRPVLLRMLKAPDEGMRAIASRQIIVAALDNADAVEDAQQVLAGDVACRKAAAEIYAHNLARPTSRAICVERLSKLFHDSNSKVRAAASDCFRLLPVGLLSREQDLIFKFIESPACLENSHDLIRALEDSAEPLPDVICSLPERLIAENRVQASGQHVESRRWTYRLPVLIARLYEQTPDAGIKRRCLDIIDGMLELGFGGIEKELAQVER
jgi:hypothetical protein